MQGQTKMRRRFDWQHWHSTGELMVCRVRCPAPLIAGLCPEYTDGRVLSFGSRLADGGSRSGPCWSPGERVSAALKRACRESGEGGSTDNAGLVCKLRLPAVHSLSVSACVGEQDGGSEHTGEILSIGRIQCSRSPELNKLVSSRNNLEGVRALRFGRLHLL
jgi:hypothetical protein